MGRSAAILARARKWLWLGLVLVAVLPTYAFVGSAGRSGDWPIYMSHYDRLADGFREGQLHLPVVPPPELLAKKNPFDPANGKYWIIDVSLHEGKYYIYWGPAPALLQAIAKTVLRIHRTIGDQYLLFVFFSFATFFGALLVDRMARRLFDDVPRWIPIAGIVALAFVNPVTHLIATGGVYQAAISGGQAFLLAGLVPAFDAVIDEGPLRRRRLVLAGTAWALAIACRVSLLPAVALLVLLTALGASPTRQVGRLVVKGLWLGVPVAATGFLLLLYNKLRFDQWFEFGTNIQLTYFKFRLAGEYWLPNVYSYLFRPLRTSCDFPYAFATWGMGSGGLPSWLARPPGYLMNEPLAGVFVAAPLAWLAPAALVGAVRAARSLRAPSANRENAARDRAYLWCAGSFVVLSTVTALGFMGLYFATMRYLADMMYGIVLLALLGAFTLTLLVKKRKAWRIAWGTGFVGVCAATIVLGLLLGYRGYTGHFEQFNPKLHAKLTSALSLCGW